jgi:hypothetical protein
MPPAPQKVDRPARDRAAGLIRQYLDGHIPGSLLADDWPASESDPALHGIGREILGEIPGGRFPERLPDEHAEHLRQILQRCELFLGADMPYAWGSLGTGSCATYGCTAVVLIIVVGTIFAVLGWEYVGLALLLLTVIVAGASIQDFEAGVKENPRKVRDMVDGDLKHWPFELAGDYLAVKEGKDPFAAADSETAWQMEDKPPP